MYRGKLCRATKHQFIMKVALRTGNVFPLCDDRVKQFRAVKLRGYVEANGEYKNPFADKPFEQATIEYRKRNKERKARQAERKRRREESILEKLENEKKKNLKKAEKRKKDAARKRNS